MVKKKNINIPDAPEITPDAGDGALGASDGIIGATGEGIDVASEQHDVAFVEGGVHAGFPSPAQDYMNTSIDLNKELVRHPAATFFAKVVGDSMVDAGVEEGDILVVDKSLEPAEGDMAVCFIDGEFALKYISFRNPVVDGYGNQRTARKARKPGVSYDILDHKRMWLLPANKKYPPIEVTDANDFTIWGVVTYVIKKVMTH
jgi:DNA polymerase V